MVHTYIEYHRLLHHDTPPLCSTPLLQNVEIVFNQDEVMKEFGGTSTTWKFNPRVQWRHTWGAAGNG